MTFQNRHDFRPQIRRPGISLVCLMAALILPGCGNVDDALALAIRKTSDAIVASLPPGSAGTGGIEAASDTATPGDSSPESVADDPQTAGSDESGMSAADDDETVTGPDEDSSASDDTDLAELELPNSDQTTSNETTSNQTGPEPTQFESAMLARVNAIRTSGAVCGDQNMAAVAPVQWNQLLAVAAHSHNIDMAHNGFFSHEGSDGSRASERIEAAGYQWRAMGENIAAGYPTTDSVMAGWMDSPGHCRNIMDPDFVEIGVDVIDGDPTSQYSTYWSMELAAPLSID